MNIKAFLLASLLACSMTSRPAAAPNAGSRAAGPGTHAPAAAIPALPGLPLLPGGALGAAQSPALSGGASLSPGLAPAPGLDSRLLAAPLSMDSSLPGQQVQAAAMSPSVQPAAPRISMDSSLPGRQVAVTPAVAAAQASLGNPAQPTALGSARAFAQGLAPQGALGGAALNSARSAAFFDGARHAPPAAESPAPAPPDARLGRLYPRVVMILDPFDGPASQRTVQHIESLLDQGVRVIFVTPRPEKGENSADSVLVSQLRVRTGTPVIVVSYNGARVTAHNSRAANPRPLLDDLDGFPPATLAKFREINARLRERFKIHGELAEFGLPDEEKLYIYGAELPNKSVNAARFATAYNRALRAAGLPYKIEMHQPESGRPFFFTQSTALKLNASRIFAALYAQFPELNSSLTPQQVLILADPAKAPTFLRSLPQRGYFMHGVTSDETLVPALGSVLGVDAHEKVVVQRHELREYVEWLDRREKYGASRGRSSAPRRNTDAPYHQELAFFRGILVKELMGRLYHNMRKGQYDQASLEAAIGMLERMWRNPRANGIFIPEEIEVARKTPGWSKLQRGYLDITRRWLANYYSRTFPDYPRGVSERVAGRLINLSRDSKNSVPLDYVAPFTGRRYVVYVLPDRSEVELDDRGFILTAHVYRTGREPYAKEFNESVEVNLVGRALLEGYADLGPDGRWYLNGEPDPRIKVVFHYNTRDLTHMMTTADIATQTPEVTALIEKRQADKDFSDYLEQREKARKRAQAVLKSQATKKKAKR